MLQIHFLHCCWTLTIIQYLNINIHRIFHFQNLQPNQIAMNKMFFSNILMIFSSGALCVTAWLPLSCHTFHSVSCQTNVWHKEQLRVCSCTRAWWMAQNSLKTSDRCDVCYLATVSRDWVTFSPVAALHSMNVKLYSCGIKNEMLDDQNVPEISDGCHQRTASYLGKNFTVLTFNLPFWAIAFITKQQNGHVIRSRFLQT